MNRAQTLSNLRQVVILDPHDPRIADYQNLKDVALRRRIEPERGLYMAESTYVIERALNAGHRPRSFLTSQRHLPLIEDVVAQLPTQLRAAWDSDPVTYVVAEEVMEQITGYRVHRGALAAMQRPILPTVEQVLGKVSARGRIVILEDIVDHTNVGAIFRSVAALGVDAVFISPECADPLYRRSVRVSMGAVFQVPWTRFDSWPAGLELLQEAGFVVAGMTLGAGAITLDDFVEEQHENLALVFGTEGHGISPAADRILDRRVTIPMMAGVDSLNVAAASAVAIYALR